MPTILKELIAQEIVACDDETLLDLIYKLLLTEATEPAPRWADIPGHGEKYEVSTDGEIRNKKTGKSLEHFTDKKGYHFVSLRGKNIRVHRVVASVFIPNPENKPQVNHINGKKADNRVSNLEWATASENVQHAYAIGAKKPAGAASPSNKHLRHKIAVVCLETGEVYPSICDAASKTGIAASGISLVCKKPKRTAGGYHWAHEEHHEKGGTKNGN